MTKPDVRGYWESLHTARPGLDGIGYVALGQPFNRWMYRVRRAVFLSTVSPYVSGRGGLEVLDVGSGTGFYIDLWRELGLRQVTGSDLTDAAVRRLNARYPHLKIVRLDIGGEPAQLPPRRFDVVSAFDVLFHIIDDERYRQAFRNLAALIRPGGLLVFSENFLRGDRRRVEPVQVSRSLAEIESLVGEHGFQALLRRRMFFLMNFPADSANLLHVGSWRLLELALASWNSLGAVIGPVLYPLERRLVGRPKDGPSTELMICRKAPDRGEARRDAAQVEGTPRPPR
jgi:SAM-dependent methyltransferase